MSALHPLQRVVGVRRQRHHHSAEVVSGDPLRIEVVTHRDRGQQRFGLAVVAQQQGAQRPGRHGQPHVVDRRAEPLAGRFDIRQRQRGGGEPALRGDHVIHEGRRRGERPGQFRRELARAASHAAHTLGGVADRPRQPPDVAHVIRHRRSHQLRLLWCRIGHIGAALRPGLQVHAAGHQVRRGDAVGQRVMDLADDGNPVIGKSGNEIHLP